MSQRASRYFLGLDLLPDDKLALDAWRHKYLLNLLGKPVPVENFHITLSFFGSIHDDQMEALTEQLHSIRANPFSLELAELGVFVKPQILYISLKPSEELYRLVKQCRNINALLNLKRETRAYFPHITLFRKHREVFPISVELPKLALSFQQFHLFESISKMGDGKQPYYSRRMTFQLSS